MNGGGRTAVVGAGLSGLLVAASLKEKGVPVRVYEKSRGLGGRIATRRTAKGNFDHGCPGIVPRDRAFADWLGALSSARSGDQIIGMPWMSALVRPLAAGIDIVRSRRITRLVRDPAGWHLLDDGNWMHGPFQRVVLTVPAPQAASILATALPALVRRITSVEMAPVWTCMVAFSERLDLPDQLPGSDVVLRAGRTRAANGTKASTDGWVIQMTPDFTKRQLDLDPAVIAPDLLECFADRAGTPLPAPVHLNAHRWRYTFTDAPLGEPCLSEDGVIVGGDWTLGSSAEDAWRSGRAMVETALSLQPEST